MIILVRRLVYRFITPACQGSCLLFLFIVITIIHQKADSTLESPQYHGAQHSSKLVSPDI